MGILDKQILDETPKADKRIGMEITSIWPHKPYGKRIVTIEDVDETTGLLTVRSGDKLEEVSDHLTNIHVPRKKRNNT